MTVVEKRGKTPQETASQRIIVDENAGRGTPIWDEFQRTWSDRSVEYVFLSESYPGIPDVEILDKLMGPGTILLTGDRVLHGLSIQRGFRSYTLNEHGQLTRWRLEGVPLKAPPQSVHPELLDDYRHEATSDLPGRLQNALTEKQRRRYRTARRRIRSYFGSAAAISQASLTIGSRFTPRGLLCGFVLHLAGNSGVQGLRASEGYCLAEGELKDPSAAVIHALRDQYLLQLEQVPTALFIVETPALETCRALLAGTALAGPLPEALRSLLLGLNRVKVSPCTKGRFFDAMNHKLDQLARGQTNEVTSVNFGQLAALLLSAS